LSEQRQVRPSPSSSAALTAAAGLRVKGAATIYRIFDVGYGIDLDKAFALLAANMPERVRPERGEAQAIHIANPPITVVLGTDRLTIASHQYPVEISARIFDFGVVSLRIRIPTPDELSWDGFTEFGNRVDVPKETNRLFTDQLARLMERIGPSVDRLKVAGVTEDYAVYRISRLRDPNGDAIAADALRDIDVVPLLLNEQRPLSGDARRELLPHRFSYYADDLAILTWDNALIVDPSPDEETDVQYVLEFANAQLLELRYYDALLDAELPRMYDRVASARTGIRAFRNRKLNSVLGALQQAVADSTEIVERVENSLKVTDDVYLARVYAAALEIFRGRVWRAGIDRKLSIIRDTYGMLNDEAQAARSEVLEIAIVVLILAEMLLALSQRL
jgi:hypothetical protein